MFLGRLNPMKIKYEKKRNCVSKKLFYLQLWHSSVEQQKISNEYLLSWRKFTFHFQHRKRAQYTVLKATGTQTKEITYKWDQHASKLNNYQSMYFWDCLES